MPATPVDPERRRSVGTRIAATILLAVVVLGIARATAATAATPVAPRAAAAAVAL